MRPQNLLHLSVHGRHRVERNRQFLGDVADRAAAESRHSFNPMTKQIGSTLLNASANSRQCRKQPRDRTRQRRFSDAGVPAKPHRLAVLKRNREIAQHRLPASRWTVRDAKLPDVQFRLRFSGSRKLGQTASRFAAQERTSQGGTACPAHRFHPGGLSCRGFQGSIGIFASPARRHSYMLSSWNRAIPWSDVRLRAVAHPIQLPGRHKAHVRSAPVDQLLLKFANPVRRIDGRFDSPGTRSAKHHTP